MQPRQLMHFLAAIDRGSMTHAAIDQNVTQPALSRSIRMLELELQIDLLQRGHNGVLPTREGSMFAEHARRIVASIQSARDDISAIRKGGDGAHVRIGLTEAASSSRLVRSLTEIAVTRDNLRISLDYDLQDALLGKLRRNEIEAMIDFDRRHLDFGDLEFQPLLRTSMVVLARAGHPATLGTQPFSALATYPWAILDQSGTEYWLQRMLRGADTPPQIRVRCLAPGMLRQVARESDCLIVACKPDGEDALAHEGLVEVASDMAADSYWLSMITLRRPHATSGMTQALHDITESLLGAHPLNGNVTRMAASRNS